MESKLVMNFPQLMNIFKNYSLFILLLLGILFTPLWSIVSSAQTSNTLQTQTLEYRLIV